jgi:hypothetical protein
MSSDDLPASGKQSALARLLRYAENNPEAEKALLEFFAACEHLSHAELAHVFVYGARLLEDAGKQKEGPCTHPRTAGSAAVTTSGELSGKMHCRDCGALTWERS